MGRYALGIDLGTSNCCVAVLDKGKPRVIADERGNSTTPSYMTILPGGKTLVGHLAKVQVISNPFQTAFAIKRLMGRGFQDPHVRRMAELVGYTITAGPQNEAMVKLGDTLFSPADISAIYLKSMRDIAVDSLGEEVRDAIITVPAYFNDAQRKATKEAGEKAGFNVLRLINEPTAAALAYGFRKNMDKRVAIFDFGGGTFDISVLEVSDGVFDVVGTSGDSFLGGQDYDNRLVDLAVEHFKSKHGMDLAGDKMALQRVKDAAENLKCNLSQAEKSNINLPFIANSPEGALNLDFEVTRKTFEDLTQDLTERAIGICKKVLQETGFKPEDIDDVVMVGGQSRMPAVQKSVQAFFGKPPVKGIHPDEAIALGAAIQAGMLEQDSKEVLLLDITPLSLGIQTAGDQFSVLIVKNTKVPVSLSRIFTTNQDNQARVKIVVLQGEERQASKNFALGEFTLEGIQPAPRMEPKIEVTFRIDSNGILQVRAVDQVTKEAKQVVFRNLSGSLAGSDSTSSGQMVETAEDATTDVVERS